MIELLSDLRISMCERIRAVFVISAFKRLAIFPNGIISRFMGWVCVCQFMMFPLTAYSRIELP